MFLKTETAITPNQIFYILVILNYFGDLNNVLWGKNKPLTGLLIGTYFKEFAKFPFHPQKFRWQHLDKQRNLLISFFVPAYFYGTFLEVSLCSFFFLPIKKGACRYYFKTNTDNRLNPSLQTASNLFDVGMF